MVSESGTAVDQAKPEVHWRLPDRLKNKLHRFIADRKTGNITINLREGMILGWRVEELEQNK